jgi:hypothetical protein
MTLSKCKQEQISKLLSQGKPIRQIAEELDISSGSVWNYKMGNHRNKKRESLDKQLVPPQSRFFPKEPSLPEKTGNTVPEYLPKFNIMRPEYYQEVQLLRIAEQQDIQREQNKRVAIELLKQKIEDINLEKVKEHERQELIDREIADIKRLLERNEKERRDQEKIAILETRLDQLSQLLNKPKESPRETRATLETLKPSEEKLKEKVPIIVPQSPPQEIQKNNPDTVPERLSVREKPLVIPSESQRNHYSELKKVGHVDYTAIIAVKIAMEIVRPWLNPNKETAK